MLPFLGHPIHTSGLIEKERLDKRLEKRKLTSKYCKTNTLFVSKFALYMCCLN